MNRVSRLVSLSVVLACGCGPASSPTGNHAGASTQAEPSAAHAMPAHYPASFVAAVEQLPTTFAPLLQDTPATPDALQRLRDIAKWLPALAAETDLRRAEWEQAQQAALGLEQLIQSSPSVPLPERKYRFERIEADLRALALAAVPPPHAH